MSRYTHQVVLRVGNAEPGLRAVTGTLETKWSAIKKRPPENHTVVSIFKDSDSLQLTKLIDDQSTRFYVLGHGSEQNNNLICGNPNIESERLTSRELAKQISQVIDRTKIGTEGNPLKINLIMCLAGYSQQNQKSFAENLIHALLDYGIRADVIARESLVLVSPVTGRKQTLTNTARDNFIENVQSWNPVTQRSAMQELKHENLEHTAKFRYDAVKNTDFTYTVRRESIIRNERPALPPSSDELFLVLNAVLQGYKDRAPDHGDIKARLYCFFRTNASKESLDLYAALNAIAAEGKSETLPQRLSEVLNTHVGRLKPDSTLRRILFETSLIDKNGNVNFELNPSRSAITKT